MSTLVVRTGYLTGRLLRAIARQPAYVIVLLIQPIIWLVLFGQLFKAVVDVPGFGGGSYIDFLHPRDRHHDRALLGRMGGDGVHR